MNNQVIYVFLDSRTEDAALTLDPMKYQGVEDWYQVGEVNTMIELKDLLSKELFDPEYWTALLEEMSPEIFSILNK
jgi:hypothetical protein